MNEAAILSKPTRPKVNPHSVWSVVNVLKMVLLASGAFALACSGYSLLIRTHDDNVIVGAIFFGAFTVCVGSVAVLAGLHRVFLAVHLLAEELTDIAEPDVVSNRGSQ